MRRSRGPLSLLVTSLRSSFAMGVYSTLMVLFVLGIVTGMGGAVDEAQHPVRGTRQDPLFIVRGEPGMGWTDFRSMCKKRAMVKDQSKKVAYLPNGYPVEAYIKNAFKELGFTNTGDDSYHTTFVIGKGTVAKDGWKVCNTTQKHNHIPGERFFASKNLLEVSMRERDRLTEGKGLSSAQFLKKTYLTYQQEECKKLLDTVQKIDVISAEESRKPIFIQKSISGGHNGKGLVILDRFDMEAMLKTFKRTGKCQTSGKHIVQEFLSNPLLIDGRTFNLRLYFVVLRTDPALVAYHDGYVRLTKQKYQSDSTDLKHFVSNSEKVWKDKRSGDKHFMTLEDFTKHIDVPEGYLDSTLRPKFMQIVEYAFRAVQPRLEKSPQYFGLYGPDMTLDKDLNPWLFEVNYSPELSRFVPLDTIPDMYTDIVRAQLQLLTTPNSTWHDIQSHLKTPDNFHIVVDEQRRNY